MTSTNKQFSDVAVLIWMIIQSFYWLFLFDPKTMLTITALAFGSTFGVVIIHAWHYFNRNHSKRFLLLVSYSICIVAFSVVAYILPQPCGCYTISWIDFVPNFISLMLCFVALMLQLNKWK